MEVLEQVLQLYREKYFDFNVQHFHEKLQAEHGIQQSYTWVKTALQESGLVERRKKRGSHNKRPVFAAGFVRARLRYDTYMAFHLAQLNVGRILHPIDHPQIKEFIDGLDHINALADQWPGFVWRLQTESGNATDVHHPWSHDPFALVNMSVWKSPEDLKEFVYHSGHLEYYLKRSDWFEKPSQAHYVLWWVPEGHIPSLEEARHRLERYRANGPTPHAFWFGKLFPAPAVSEAPV